MIKEALYYYFKDGVAYCTLCPHMCNISKNKRGICGVRKNNGKILVAETYNQACSISLDPIEKKPLYHFYPGSNILSIGSIGCNLKCVFCQNSEISQATPDNSGFLRQIIPLEIIAKAQQLNNNIGIAFTYNEPTVFYEYMFDVAELAKKNGFVTAMISNGFINQEPLEKIIPFMDSFNIDLKAFTDDFYKTQTKSHLSPVLQSLKTIRNNNKHLEITNLIIPGLNDNIKKFEEMISWIADNLGTETVLHLSKYFPRHKMAIRETPPETILDLYNIAINKLQYVYIGNINLNEGKDTICPKCKSVVISRSFYKTHIQNLDTKGCCKNCGKNIIKNI